MDYSQVISEENRGLFIITIDQSGSMLSPFQNVSMITTKSEIASMIASTIIDELVLRSQKEFRMSDPCPYCDIAVIGYSRNEVTSLIHDSTYVLPITALNPNKHPVKCRTIEYVTKDNHLDLILETWREWVEPKAVGITPTADMLSVVTKIVSEWCYNRRNQDSFPPIIINITDGLERYEYTRDVKTLSNIIKNTGTKYGKTLFFNVCISDTPRNERLQFPSPKDIDPSHPIAYLASISSELPTIFYPVARQFNNGSKPPYVCVCYNDAILQILANLKFNLRWDSWRYTAFIR